jgi:bifunctional non-homologous end joining protein LigD
MDTSKFPPKIEIMKADTAPSHDLNEYENKGWFAQEKLDGTNVVVVKNGTEIHMMTRSWKNDLADSYPEIAAELSMLPSGTVLESELVFYKKSDLKPEFVTALATSDTKKNYDVRLMIFDVLKYDGENKEDIPQSERTKFVNNLVVEKSWNFVWSFPCITSGFNGFYKSVTENGGEGIVMKKMDAKYKEDTRSKSWLKVKKFQTDDCVVLGLATGENKYSHLFGALVVGQYINGKMQVVARVSGMTDVIRNELNTMVRSLPSDVSLGDAFWKGPTGKDVFHKIAPKMVVEVEFMERTTSGKMRHPRFVRVRDDKLWTECIAQLEDE